MLRTWKTWLMVGLLAVSVGCQRHRVRPAPVAAAPCPPGAPIPVPHSPGGFAAPPGGFGVAPGPVAPPPGAGGFTLPPGAVTTPPPGATVIPPADPLSGGANPAPGAPPGPGPRVIPPGPAQVDYRWTPSPQAPTPPMRTLAPKTLMPEPGEPTPKGPSRVLLFPPEISEDPPLDPRPAPRKGASPLPVGIPGFAAARENVATGLRPSLDEGLDWLKGHDYQTVLHLHQPFDIAAADRKQVEKRGMNYISLAIDPRNLSKETTDEFLRIVSDTSGHPLFVYDRDGSLAGPLWYLYFRVVEELPDDASRVRAGGLGLRETGAMWDAARRMAP